MGILSLFGRRGRLALTIVAVMPATFATIIDPAHSAEAGAKAEDSKISLSLSLRNNLLTMDARNVPLDRLLDDLARKAGFKLEIRGSLKTRITRSFRDLPLGQAVRRIVGRNSYVVEFDRTVAPDRPRRLIGLSVIGRRSADRRGTAISRRKSDAASRAGGQPAQALRIAKRNKLRDIRRLNRKKTPETARRLTRLLLKDEDREVRATAAGVLAGFRGQAVSGSLIAALEDGEVTVRRRVIVALGRVGGDEAIDALIQILAASSDARSRAFAAGALGRFSQPRSLSALRKATGDPVSRVRNAASSSLSRLTRIR